METLNPSPYSETPKCVHFELLRCLSWWHVEKSRHVQIDDQKLGYCQNNVFRDMNNQSSCKQHIPNMKKYLNKTHNCDTNVHVNINSDTTVRVFCPVCDGCIFVGNLGCICRCVFLQGDFSISTLYHFHHSPFHLSLTLALSSFTSLLSLCKAIPCCCFGQLLMQLLYPPHPQPFPPHLLCYAAAPPHPPGAAWLGTQQ